MYVSLLLKKATSNALYKYSLSKAKMTGHTWYADKPLGVNTITKTVKNLMAEISKFGHFTNHSLRVSAVTRMYSEGVDEQVLKERMGHCSDAVRTYKKTPKNLLCQAEKAAISDMSKSLKRPVLCTVSTPPESHVKVEPKDMSDNMSACLSLGQMLEKVDSSSTHVKKVKFEVEYHDVRGKSHKRVPADSDHFLCLTDPSQLVVSLPCVQK